MPCGVETPVGLLVVPVVKMPPVPAVPEPPPQSGKGQWIPAQTAAAQLVEVNIVEIFQIIIFLQMDKGLIPERAPPGAVLLPDTVRIRNRIQRQHCVPGGIVRLLCSRCDIESESVFRLPGESEPRRMRIDDFRRTLTGGRQCCFAASQILCHQDPVVMDMGFYGVYPLVMGMKDLLVVVDEMRTGPFVHEDLKLYRLIAADREFHC